MLLNLTSSSRSNAQFYAAVYGGESILLTLLTPGSFTSGIQWFYAVTFEYLRFLNFFYYEILLCLGTVALCRYLQREGMGQLWCRPCLPCVTYLMAVFCVHLVIDQPQTGASCVVRQAAWTSITYKIKPCWVTLLQPARRAAVLDQHSSLHY
jgi:hypothetical protein